MVTETKPLTAELSSEARDEFRSRLAAAYPVVRSLASLKLTVVLFAMAIFIVLAGTLAQVNKDIWQVIGEYFRINVSDLFTSRFPWGHPGAAFVWIDFQIFVPPAFFPSKPVVPGGFYFPKGWTIGVLLGLNLIAAHLVQFRVQARGWRLWIGLAILSLGVLLTGAVIAAGADAEGFQDWPGLSWSTLWMLFKLGLVALWGGLLAGLFVIDETRKAERGILIGSAVALGSFLLWLFVQGDTFRLGDSSMRILWQLIKATFAGGVLLVGCLLVFRRRGGMVLLHGGIGLLMLSELFVGTGAQEAQMLIQEGQTVNYATDIRSLELAIVDPSPRDYDDVVVVPESILLRNHKRHESPDLIRHADLPFDIQVVRFFRNSTIRDVRPGEENPATAGAGLLSIVDPARPVAATDPLGGTDMSSAYLRFIDKASGEDLGTYLMSLYLRPQTVKVNGRDYEVALRHKRVYKPYTVHLIDVRKDDYLGTNTPRNYSSDIRLVENDATRQHLSPLFAGSSTRNVDRKIHIWMNNPLRYAGETFYQSGYWKDPRTGVERTTLQVVVNPSWMIPYVACMIVATGMLAHFWLVLTRFLNQRVARPAGRPAGPSERTPSTRRQRRREQKAPPANQSKRSLQAYWLVPTILVVLCGGWVASKARVPHEPGDAMKLYEFGKLPLMFEGRSKPFDTFARNSLRIISDRQTFIDSEGRRQPAIRWLLDVIARPDEAEKHRVFRIRHPGVLDLLGLEPRPGSRYSVEELRTNIDEFDKQVRLAAGLAADDRTLFQRKVLQLRQKISRYTLILAAFRKPALPDLKELGKNEQEAAQVLQRFKHAYDMIRLQNKQLAASEPPLAVPVLQDERPKDLPASLRAWLSERQPWETYAEAVTTDLVRQKLFRLPANPATVSLQNILAAYRRGDAAGFNQEVARYRDLLVQKPPSYLTMRKIAFEAFFNHFEPFYYASLLYLLAFLLAVLSWLGWGQVLNRSALWLIVLTFFLHTFALGARIYISGRPPVTNLYSSAVFIGWGGVIFGWVLELIYRRGLGNVVASVLGFATLVIAHMLAGDGDTFNVLQAVLDTQFWLTTHVVCITLGYSATFVAGLLGVLYILQGVATPSLKPDFGKDLARMIYGTICFAIFFSFVGTVLRGLWADDSWGRFWGWDPKEN
ncbi:MAG TPA: hypothetical protein EYP14_00915, partial [Planctomycetaceae bacterium]|nr:hypothetical protein [Planctomycetaceae bacterium]